MTTDPLRIVFAGTPAFAATVLQSLLGAPGVQVVGVLTQPDRPSGRGRRLQASAVRLLAQQHALPLLQPERLGTTEQRAPLAELRPELLVVVAYGLILPRAVIELPRHGCINVHASLLPRWRGAAPIERAIEAGDSETGVTIMQMNEGLDTGRVLGMAHCPILPDDTGGSLRERLAGLGARALLEALTRLRVGALSACAQEDALATYARKLDRAEALLDWQQDAAALARRVRAFNPGNVCHTRIATETLRVWMAVPGETTAGVIPGTVLGADRLGIRVACGNGGLVLTELQLSGGKPMPAAELLNGRGALFAAGSVLG